MRGAATFKKFKKLLVYLKRRNPVTFGVEEDGLKIGLEDKSFNPKKQEHSGRTYLIIVHGDDREVKEVEEHPDDMVLSYSDKICAITSKPLTIEGNNFYITKPGFLGTMALNKDTLLAGDVYQPSKEDYRRKISKKIDTDKLEVDLEEKAVDDTETHYIIESEDMGDVSALYGSKKTLNTMNKGKRLRKLLQTSKLDKTKLIMAIGMGIAIGLVLYPKLIGGA